MRTAVRLASALIPLALATAAAAQPPSSVPDPSVRSATAFLSPELRAEQQDDLLNRGMLWVEEGRRLWQEPAGGAARSCASCHGEATRLHGVATRYPLLDAVTGSLLNVEGRINVCRVRYQRAAALAQESQDLLALTALIAYQSRGLPVSVDIDARTRPHLENGRRMYETRQGQLDLACRHCHEANVGRKLRGDTISSGLGTGYPAYRLEWQGLGSLHRRLRACQVGVRAVDLAPGTEDHLSLELYLAWRARGLPVEAPAVRR
jgi:L-cysteine S-thiosulfotransferase